MSSVKYDLLLCLLFGITYAAEFLKPIITILNGLLETQPRGSAASVNTVSFLYSEHFKQLCSDSALPVHDPHGRQSKEASDYT